MTHSAAHARAQREHRGMLGIEVRAGAEFRMFGQWQVPMKFADKLPGLQIPNLFALARDDECLPAVRSDDSRR